MTPRPSDHFPDRSADRGFVVTQTHPQLIHRDGLPSSGYGPSTPFTVSTISLWGTGSIHVSPTKVKERFPCCLSPREVLSTLHPLPEVTYLLEVRNSDYPVLLTPTSGVLSRVDRPINRTTIIIILGWKFLMYVRV